MKERKRQSNSRWLSAEAFAATCIGLSLGLAFDMYFPAEAREGFGRTHLQGGTLNNDLHPHVLSQILERFFGPNGIKSRVEEFDSHGALSYVDVPPNMTRKSSLLFSNSITPREITFSLAFKPGTACIPGAQTNARACSI